MSSRRGNGLTPVWQIPGIDKLHAVDLLWALGAGVVGALVAVTFTFTVLGLRRVFARISPMVRPVVGGVVLATLGLWSTYALTFGEAQTGHVLLVGSGISVGVLATAIIAKMLGTSVTVSSGFPGGFIIPLFFMGAALGQLTHHAFSSASVGVMCAAFMAATNVGVTKTLLGSTLCVTEMGGFRLLPTTLLAATVALMLTSTVGLIETQRERTPMDE